MKVGIVGGGMAGLSAAHYLSRGGHKVALFEKNNELGGLLSGVKIGDSFVEKFYHHLFTGDRFMIELIKEVGLEERLVFKKAPMATYYEDRIYPFSSALDLLRFSPLSLADRLRVGLVSLYLKSVSGGQKFSTVTAQDWLKRYYGERAYKVVWEPLLRSKFGENASGISMAWFWSRVHDRTFSLGYLRGGFQLLIDKIGEELQKSGAEISLGVSISSISADSEGKTVIRCNNGNVEERFFDEVVVATPLPIFLNLVEGLPEDYVKNLETIKFRSALSLILVLEKSFMGCYWLNVNDEEFPFVAVVEHTNFASNEDYGGKTILYVGSYLDANDEKMQMSKGQLLNLYTPYLQKINPDFKPAWIADAHLFRGNFAQPIATTDYESKIPPFETPVENVYLATMAQVYPQDRGTNQAVEQGKNAAKIISS